MSASALDPALVPAAAKTAARRNFVGIALALGGLVLFAVNNALIKWLLERYPVSEMLFARSAVALTLLAPFLRAGDLDDFRLPRRAALHVVRMLISSAEVMCFFVAAALLPLADVSAIYLAAPIYVTGLAALLLGERVGWRRWLAVLAGFAGVLVALDPSARALSSGPAALALLGSAIYAFVIVCTRALSGASARVLLGMQLVALLLVSGFIPGAAWTMPVVADCALIGLVGAISLVSNALFNRSLQIAPASVVSPFQYSGIIWAVLLGWLVFAEVPAASTLAGAAIIVGAGLFILWREQVRSREGRPMAG